MSKEQNHFQSPGTAERLIQPMHPRLRLIHLTNAENHHVPSTVPGTRNEKVSRADMNGPALMELIQFRGEHRLNVKFQLYMLETQVHSATTAWKIGKSGKSSLREVTLAGSEDGFLAQRTAHTKALRQDEIWWVSTWDSMKLCVAGLLDLSAKQ